MEKKEIFGRVENPLVIRLSHLGNYILPMNDLEDETIINEQGILISNELREHYGFTIISDYNNHQSEESYRTDNKIIAVQMSNGKLKIYEENRMNPWIFMKNGKILSNNNATVDFSHKKSDIDINPLGHLEQNDGLIKIVIDTIRENITIDANGEELPICPGVVFGNEYYGITIEVIKLEDGEEKVIKTGYRTEDTLFGIEGINVYGHSDCIKTSRKYHINEIETIRVFERSKYHPWEFSNTGELIKKSAYNFYSRREVDAYEDKYKEKAPRLN